MRTRSYDSDIKAGKHTWEKQTDRALSDSCSSCSMLSYDSFRQMNATPAQSKLAVAALEYNVYVSFSEPLFLTAYRRDPLFILSESNCWAFHTISKKLKILGSSDWNGESFLFFERSNSRSRGHRALMDATALSLDKYRKVLLL